MPNPTAVQTVFNANGTFINRDQARMHFLDALNKVQLQSERRVLTWSGMGGQGKSALLEAFERILTQSADHPVGHALITFENIRNREVDTALLNLREQLHATAGLHFPLFEFACLRYLAMTHPDLNLRDLKAKFFSTGSEYLDALLQGLNAIGEFGAAAHVMPGFSLITKYGIRLLGKAGGAFVTWWDRRGVQAFADIDELGQDALLRRLPIYFGADLVDALSMEGAPRVVIMFDTYEALWRNHGLRGGPGSLCVDDWVRTLVQHSPGALFVVAGRQDLKWHIVDKAAGWNRVIAKHTLDGLNRPHSHSLLFEWGVKELDIRNCIIDGARNQELNAAAADDDSVEAYLPFYLELQTKTYWNIKNAGEVPTPDDFDAGQPQILERFMEHLDEETAKHLRIASYLSTLDPELLDYLGTKFLGGQANADWSRLYRLGLVSEEKDGQGYFHNLLRKALQEDEKSARPRLYSAVHQALFEWFESHCQPDKSNSVTPDQERAILSAIKHLVNVDATKSVTWACAQMQRLSDAEKWHSLEMAGELVLPVAQGNSGPEAKLTLAILGWLASAASASGRYAEAEKLLKSAWTVQKRTLGVNDSGTIATLHGLADVYRNSGNFEKAERLYKRVLSNYKKIVSLDDPLIVRTLLDLVGVYSDTGRYDLAEMLCEQVRVIQEQALGPESPGIAKTLGNLAGVYSDTGRYDEAQLLFKRVLAINKTSFGSSDPATAATLHNLAGVYAGVGRYTEAEAMFTRVQAIYEQHFGREHPKTATTLANLAGVYTDTGRYTEAEALYHKVRTIHEKILGPEHPRTLTTVASLVGVYRESERYAEAEPLCDVIRKIEKYTLDRERPWAATILLNLAGVYSDTGRYVEAEELLTRVLAIDEQTFGMDHPWTATSRYSLAGVYRDSAKRYTESAILFEMAWRVLSSKLPPGNPKLAKFRVQRGKLFAVCGDRNKAIDDFSAALDVFEGTGVRPEYRWKREAIAAMERLQSIEPLQ